MRRASSNRGFSLIDAILAIVIVSSTFLALGSVISSTTMQNVDLDLSTTAILLARGKMGEVMAKDFANVSSVVDTNFTGDFSNFSAAVNVSYVNSTDLDTAVAGPTDYKRVEVVVGHSNWAGNIRLFDLKAKLQ